MVSGFNAAVKGVNVASWLADGQIQFSHRQPALVFVYPGRIARFSDMSGVELTL